MFTPQQKQWIASEVEKILLHLSHPEMPEDKVNFKLHVDGAEKWSWADIVSNHEHDASLGLGE